MRTLVISDLHLGSRLGRDVLRHPEALERLLAALDEVDRLVLLGDTIELAEGRPHQVMRAAEPVLRAIGARLGPERQVVLVPGNHDAALTQRWTSGRGEALTVDAQVPLDATPRLSRVTSWLAPAQVRVHAPGVWLSSRVWATHGHYLDRHLLPESAWGMTRERFGRTAAERVGPSVYERRRRASRTRVESELVRWLPRPLALLIEDAAELLRAATMPGPRRFPSHRLAPLTARLLGAQMQRASIPALAHVTHRLGVDADWVLFGHVHRAGPLPSDDEALWAGPDRRPRVANTGCWVYEPLVLHGGRPPHPYWPGCGLMVVDEGDPEVVSLLDDVDVERLFARGRG